MTAPVSPSEFMRHLDKLTQQIGVRLAGSAQEQAAADYIAAVFTRNGATEVWQESFPVMQRHVSAEKLWVKLQGSWRKFPCSLFSSTPGTDGADVEAPLLFFEAPAAYELNDLSHLRGKAVVHLGTHIESRQQYRRLMAAEPAFLLFVDVRYPGTTPLADGMFPSYTRDLGARPTLNVAYMDAWRWRLEGAEAARINVAGGMQPARSQNIIAELAGQGDEVIYVGAHHDTQADSVGADDNGSGVAALLELCRVLAPHQASFRRSLRLISFGAEEQLSVGSANYVRQHQEDLARNGRFMFNFDGFSSVMGWFLIYLCGDDALEKELRNFLQQSQFPVKLSREVVPYTDQFPFAAAGIPGLWLHRNNCTAGRFFHHRPDDDITRVSAQIAATAVAKAAALLYDWAVAETLPFSSHIPAAQAGEVQRLWDDLYGGW